MGLKLVQLLLQRPLRHRLPHLPRSKEHLRQLLWYCNREISHVGFAADGEFNSVLTNFKVDFNDKSTENIVLKTGADTGHGVIERLFVNTGLTTDDTYKKYLTGGIF